MTTKNKLLLSVYLGIPLIAYISYWVHMNPKIDNINNFPSETRIILYEGLPHPTWDREGLADERVHKETHLQHKFSFYDEQLQLTDEDQQTILNIIQSRGFIKRIPKNQGMKRCGGFHPDWSLHLKTTKGLIEIQLCFGCKETKIFHAGNEQLFDTGKNLETLLKKYQKNRPLESFKQREIKALLLELESIKNESSPTSD